MFTGISHDKIRCHHGLYKFRLFCHNALMSTLRLAKCELRNVRAARPSRSLGGASRAALPHKDVFGGTPNTARETHALPIHLSAIFHWIRQRNYRLLTHFQNRSMNLNRLKTAWLVVLLALAGCTRSEPPADLVMINGPDPETLDPALATGIEDLRVIAGLFEGLTRNDPVTAAPIPGLAERWEISSNGCVYTFHLRDKLLWSPGEPITAQDMVYSWLRVLNPETAAEYAGQLFYVKNGEDYNSGKIKDPSLVGVHALDARTVQVELNQPTAFFLDLCAFQTLCVVPRQVIEKYGEDWMRARPLPASGPYL